MHLLFFRMLNFFKIEYFLTLMKVASTWESLYRFQGAPNQLMLVIKFSDLLHLFFRSLLLELVFRSFTPFSQLFFLSRIPFAPLGKIFAKRHFCSPI